ncbi:MAG: argininosuccinate lyase [Oceanidesulfovibrio sp.]
MSKNVDKLWGGRFRETTHRLMEEFSESVSYDRALYEQDIRGSMAHARMLAAQGVLAQEDAEAICRGLEQVRQEIEQGALEWKTELEDVHMNIESRLTEIVGDAGKKLHTGRSRNDQVALDFRLYVADRLESWRKALGALVAALAAQAEAHRETILPGCTHFQPAQPVALAHHLLAYAAMLMRDEERITDCLKRVRVSPLGAAALAGTTYPIDPERTAEELGLPATFANSMDAVSDRDFAVEAVFCASLVMAHLSRFAEEIIIWANPGFGFVKLPDAFATGSSIMPQKKNPDSAELVRGKTGRVYGSLMSLLTVVKGLPMTYNRDLQEDKEPFFDTDRTVCGSLGVMAGLVSELEFLPEPMARALDRGFVNATELADYLVTKGTPFREAHHASGKAVALAESRGCGLESLSLGDFQAIAPAVDKDVYAVLDYANCVARRKAPGGTGLDSVARQLEEVRRWLHGIENSE